MTGVPTMQRAISDLAPAADWTDFIRAHPDVTGLDAFIIDVNGRGTSAGDPDGTALPIRGSLCLAPWTRTPTAQVVCEMRHVDTREPYWFDPRGLLADVVRRCRAAGLHPVVACELEFYLIDPRRGAGGLIRLAASTPNSS